MDLHSSQRTLLCGVQLFEFCSGLPETARNDVYHYNLVELGVDVEYVVPDFVFIGAETHENPRSTARFQYKRQVLGFCSHL